MLLIDLLAKDPKVFQSHPSSASSSSPETTPGPTSCALVLKVKQIHSLLGLREYAKKPDTRTKTIFILNASCNRIKSMQGLEQLVELRQLELNLNQIRKVECLEELIHLHTLNVSHNYIEILDWCKGLRLVSLDLSSNLLKSVRDLAAIPTLEYLNISHNAIEKLHGVHSLANLKTLRASKNKLKDVDCLISLVSVTELAIASNELGDLDQLVKVIFAMTKLKTLNCGGNPVEQLDDYRFRILQNKSIEKLDHAIIRPDLRDRLEEFESQKRLDKMVETTTNEYMSRIEREQNILDQGLNFYRSRQEMMLTAFSQFKQQMEGELDDCISFADALSSQHRESYLLSEDGIQNWKDRVSIAEQERMEEDRKRQELEKKLKADKVADQSARLSYHQKLRELSLKKPEVWRAIKQRELNRTQKEDEAILHIVQEKQEKIKASQERLKKDRLERTKLVLKMAHDMELEVSPLWSGTVQAIEQGVKRRESDSQAVMSAEEAAFVIQRAFAKKYGPKELNTVAAVANALLKGPSNTLEASNQQPEPQSKQKSSKSKKWSIFGKKKSSVKPQ